MKKLLFILFLFSSSLHAADAIYTPWSNNIAVKGYDTVAYFTENKAIKGTKKHSTEWKDATWHFSSDENLALFKENPEKYAPQYGGYCAFALAKNNLASVDPEQFTVLNGKLYLNYNAEVKGKWLQDRDSFIEQADKNWPQILND